MLIAFAIMGISSAFAQDADADGVTDANDLCPNTPTGTTVNAYGCPASLTTCDYNTSSVTFVASDLGVIPANSQILYVLADAADGKILQIATSPTFNNLVGSKTYMVLAYHYVLDGTLVNMNVNKYINQVSAACDDWSNALVVKICAPFVPGGTCDYTTSTISLTGTTPPVGGTTQYALVSSAGTIVQISNTPTFTGLSGTNTFNAYALSYTGTINNFVVGSNFSSVTGNCYDWSQPIGVSVCVCQPICLPVTVTKIR